MKKWKKIAIVLLAFFLLLIVFVIVVVSNMKPETFTVSSVDFNSVQDGIYTGRADNGLVKATVSVEVQNGKILNISILEHDNLLGKAGEKVVDEIIGQQSLDVDAITSATYSSNTILKAVENALTYQAKE